MIVETAIIDEQQPVFGSNLFMGHFRDIKQSGFNKDYLINIRICGAFEFSTEMPVDTEGNIFLPKVGNVQVL